MENYKGYIIEPETESWALKYNQNYKFYPDYDRTGESTRYASSVDEAKEEIDEITD